MALKAPRCLFYDAWSQLVDGDVAAPCQSQHALSIDVLCMPWQNCSQIQEYSVGAVFSPRTEARPKPDESSWYLNQIRAQARLVPRQAVDRLHGRRHFHAVSEIKPYIITGVATVVSLLGIKLTRPQAAFFHMKNNPSLLLHQHVLFEKWPLLSWCSVQWLTCWPLVYVYWTAYKWVLNSRQHTLSPD